MLTNIQSHIENLFFQASTPIAGRRYVLESFANGPSRVASNRYGNALLKYVSKKSGPMLLESRRGEFAGAILMDRDESVVGFAPQPQNIELPIRDEDGRLRTRVGYPPDFLLVRRTDFMVREYRDEAALVERMSKNPFQFYMDESGRWHYRAAEETFAALGLGYEILSNQTLPSALVNNSRFLEDYLAENSPPLADEVRLSLQTLIKELRSIPMRALLGEHGFSPDDIFKAVVDGVLYVDLAFERLDVIDELTLFCDEPTYRAHKLLDSSRLAPVLPVPGTLMLRSGSQLNYGGVNYTVVLPGERDVSVRDDDGHIRTLPLSVIKELHDRQMLQGDGIRSEEDVKGLANTSSEELARALERLDAVTTGQSAKYAKRTIARYGSIVGGALTDLDALLCLVDHERDKGNRLPKLSGIVEELATKSIEATFNTPEKRTKKATYGDYLCLCEAHAKEHDIAVMPMSYVTFCKRCDDLESHRKREGKRSAYQKRAIVQLLDNAYPIHGVRPHEVCYVDHTIATIATVGPDGVELGKPTLSIGVDGNTRQPRALLLTYDPPSTWTVLLILRDYVRRHGRLPKVLSVDNGKEFHSRELAFFCRMYTIDLRYRAPGMPRGGAMIERLIGATEEEVFAAMEGNTRQMRDPRLVTKSVNPFRRAVWTLTAVYGAVEDYLFNIRPDRIHPALGMTPNEYEQQRVAETGTRSHGLVRFDENLMLMTAPHAKRPFHKLCDRRGIWVGGQWYRHPAMDTVKKGTKLEVRVEPWLYNVIYVQLNGNWVAAIGSNPRAFAGKCRREVEIAFKEQTRLSVVKANRASVSPKNLRGKEKFLHPEYYDARIGAQQREMRYLFNRLGMTTALLAPPQALPADKALPHDGAAPSASRVAAAEPEAHYAAPDYVSAAPATPGPESKPRQPEGDFVLPPATEGIYDDIAGFH